MIDTLRLTSHPVLNLSSEGSKTITIKVDGKDLAVRDGEILAAALWANGIISLGHNPSDGAHRGMYCGIGHCYECRVTVDGVEIPAVVQVTKQAFAYAFNRETGEPIWPIEERPVPASLVPGEKLSKTQPHPTRPAPFDIQGLTEDDLIDFTPELVFLFDEEQREAFRKIYPLGKIPFLVLDDGRPGSANQNCRIDSGETTRVVRFERGVAPGIRDQR